MKVIVAGIGNRFMGDDGFGPRVIDILSSTSLPEWVELRDAGTAGLSLAYDLDGYDVIIFLDAMRTGLGAGVIRRVEVEAEGLGEKELQEPMRASLHELGLADLIGFSKTIGSLPPRVILIGCEPANLSIPFGLSVEVEGAAQEAALDVLELLASISGS